MSKKKPMHANADALARMVDLLGQVSRIMRNMQMRDDLQAFELDQIRKRIARLEHAEVVARARKKKKKGRAR
jgi:hypothetical protein